jgi:hypothetical protein
MPATKRNAADAAIDDSDSVSVPAKQGVTVTTVHKRDLTIPRSNDRRPCCCKASQVRQKIRTRSVLRRNNSRPTGQDLA